MRLRSRQVGAVGDRQGRRISRQRKSHQAIEQPLLQEHEDEGCREVELLSHQHGLLHGPHLADLPSRQCDVDVVGLQVVRGTLYPASPLQEEASSHLVVFRGVGMGL
jgi:hypothetical protein